jgi:hypothetical protein
MVTDDADEERNRANGIDLVSLAESVKKRDWQLDERNSSKIHAYTTNIPNKGDLTVGRSRFSRFGGWHYWSVVEAGLASSKDNGVTSEVAYFIADAAYRSKVKASEVASTLVGAGSS